MKGIVAMVDTTGLKDPKQHILRVLQEAACKWADLSPDEYRVERGRLNVPALSQYLMRVAAVTNSGIRRRDQEVARYFELMPDDNKRALIEEALSIYLPSA